MDCATAPEFKSGPTMPNTKVSGVRTKQTAQASSGTRTETSTKASGRTTKPTVSASTST